MGLFKAGRINYHDQLLIYLHHLSHAKKDLQIVSLAKRAKFVSSRKCAGSAIAAQGLAAQLVVGW